MTSKKVRFLKFRLTDELHDQLHTEAAVIGLPVTVHVRDLLEQRVQAVSTQQAVARLEATLSRAIERPTVVDDATAHLKAQLQAQAEQLRELRLLLRELCLHTHAPLLTRAQAQLAAGAGKGAV